MKSSLRIRTLLDAIAAILSTASLSFILCYSLLKKFTAKTEIFSLAVSAAVCAFFYFAWKRKPQIRRFFSSTFAVLATGLFFVSFLDTTVRYGVKTFPIARVDEVIETLQMPISGFSAIFVREWLWTTVPVSLLFSLSAAWVLKTWYQLVNATMLNLCKRYSFGVM